MFFYNTEPTKTSNPDVVVSTAYFVLPCTTVKEFYIQEVTKRTFKKEVAELGETFYKEKFFRKDGTSIEPFKPRHNDYYELGITAFVFDTKEEAEIALSKVNETQVYFKMINIFNSFMALEEKNYLRGYSRCGYLSFQDNFLEIKKKILNLVLDKNNFYACLVNLEKEWDDSIKKSRKIKQDELEKDRQDNL